MRPRRRAPVVRRSHPLLLLLVPALLGACISSAAPPAPSPVVSSLAPVTAPPSQSVAPSSEAPSTEPTETPPSTPAATDEATATPDAASPSPSGSGSAATAEGCSGNDDNRTFFADAATAYDWPVYCAVLPAHWFVDVGSRKSGKLEISYKGPDGARFELHEGAFCAVGADCVPAGSEAGSVTFGDRMTTLIHAYDGSRAAAVDRGKKISWMAVGVNLDDATFGAFLAGLLRLD
jgi:hypothetical protein